MQPSVKMLTHDASFVGDGSRCISKRRQCLFLDWYSLFTEYTSDMGMEACAVELSS